MFYKGKYKVKNPHKYIGDAENIIYRSSWERAVFKWLDENTSILEFSSEEISIPYLCETDKKIHRYFPDLWFKTESGEKYLIEIKPKKETVKPKKNKNRSRYLNESLTYIKNQSKWSAAQNFSKKMGWKFEVWTEDTLKSLGIKIIK